MENTVKVHDEADIYFIDNDYNIKKPNDVWKCVFERPNIISITKDKKVMFSNRRCWLLVGLQMILPEKKQK